MDGSSEQGPGTETLAGLRNLSGQLDRQAVERVEDALDRAGHESTPRRLAQQIDREAVAVVRNAAGADALLAVIGLDRLGRLLERCSAALAGGGDPDPALRKLTWDALDLVRRPAVLRRIEADQIAAWSDRILKAVEASHLTVGPLFRQRAEQYGSKVLFEIPRGDELRTMTWRQAAARVDFLARGLLSLDSSETPAPVAILSENRIEMALVDLACMTSGLKNVLVPANATDADVGYMLQHSKSAAVVVSDEHQLQKVLKHRESLTHLKRIITIEPARTADSDVLSLDQLAARATHIPGSLVISRSEAVRIDDCATVMYTSGTTGTPKGIQFSQRNLVFKRFARALALPEIGQEDCFLCFLPLFHTFGRFFEMLGSIFWGARYCFMGGTSVEAMVRAMRRHQPTVFISVPKKWIQLYEYVTQTADPLSASDAELLEATRQATGGRLRWGLSAAGHLDTDIFRFFQRQGVELMSGFGMTEATGGITMTPPGGYRDGSLGRALPGIELELAPDRELLIRGPYVMLGYLDPPDDEHDFDERGWLHSGDLMEVGADGFYRLIDRKKEIYKNVQGETIAPQRIENLFRDFDSVGRAFLVGDHREYNTLLIYPNPDYDDLDFSSMSAEETWSHFRSLAVSVNKFLATYERIVDFVVIDRDLDEERGELTPKGTPRRTTVVENFRDVIRSMYHRTNIHVGGVELVLPNWLFQSLGLTAPDIQVGDERILLRSHDTSLTVQRQDADLVRIGSCFYSHQGGPLNLGQILSSPSLWLGNRELVDFVPLDNSARHRPGRGPREIEWTDFATLPESTEQDVHALQEALRRPERDLLDLHLAARLLGSSDAPVAVLAVLLLEEIIGEKEATLVAIARLILARATRSSSLKVLRRAFQVMVQSESEIRFAETLRSFLERDPRVLDDESRTLLAESNLSEGKIEVLIAATQSLCMRDEPATEDDELASSLLKLLSAYGAAHPVRYQRLRAFLTRMGLFARSKRVAQEAIAASESLSNGFRAWLGPTARMAVDPETGREYRWADVVVFDDDVPDKDRRRLLAAIKASSLLREAYFLFSTGALLHLSDIPPGGVSVRLLGSRHGKSVFRITVQTRFRGAYDLAVNVNHSLTAEQVQEELQLLVLSGDPGQRDPLVEDFGGYWPEYDLWSEEFISGETLERAMKRLSRQSEEGERLQQIWPFLAWSTLSAYVDFWDRSGRRWETADPSMSNIVVPTEDYHIGARIVSLSARRRHAGLPEMLQAFHDQLVAPAEQQYPNLTGRVGWKTILSSLLEIVGESDGLEMLSHLIDDPAVPADLTRAARDFSENIRQRGFLPMRLYFAADRYQRWEQLSSSPTVQARARTLRELYETYGLERLAQAYPEVRCRLYRETVLRNASTALTEGLELLISRIRSGELHVEELVDAVVDLRSKLDLVPDEDYFLARLSFPHLRPEDAAGFVSSHFGGHQQSEIVVTFQDHDGSSYRVRHALSPKEVGRLHRLFLAAKLEVHFRAEHQYLVVMNERGHLVAGIYYEVEEDAHSAHLEKIVVTEPLRRKGVADALMKEFFNRLRAAAVKTVTTGFFRPEYFYSYGFRIEKRYAGLVKSLEEESGATRPSDRSE